MLVGSGGWSTLTHGPSTPLFVTSKTVCRKTTFFLLFFFLFHIEQQELSLLPGSRALSSCHLPLHSFRLRGAHLSLPCLVLHCEQVLSVGLPCLLLGKPQLLVQARHTLVHLGAQRLAPKPTVVQLPLPAPQALPHQLRR